MSEPRKSSQSALAISLVFAFAIFTFLMLRESPELPKRASSKDQAAATPEKAEPQKDRDALSLNDRILPRSKPEGDSSTEPYFPPLYSSTRLDVLGRIPRVADPVDGEFDPREIALAFLQSDQANAPLRKGWTAADVDSPAFTSELVCERGLRSLRTATGKSQRWFPRR